MNLSNDVFALTTQMYGKERIPFDDTYVNLFKQIIDLAAVLGVSVTYAIHAKMAKNRAKYPPQEFTGIASSTGRVIWKYNERLSNHGFPPTKSLLRSNGYGNYSGIIMGRYNEGLADYGSPPTNPVYSPQFIIRFNKRSSDLQCMSIDDYLYWENVKQGQHAEDTESQTYNLCMYKVLNAYKKRADYLRPLSLREYVPWILLNRKKPRTIKMYIPAKDLTGSLTDTQAVSRRILNQAGVESAAEKLNTDCNNEETKDETSNVKSITIRKCNACSTSKPRVIITLKDDGVPKKLQYTAVSRNLMPTSSNPTAGVTKTASSDALISKEYLKTTDGIDASTLADDLIEGVLSIENTVHDFAVQRGWLDLYTNEMLCRSLRAEAGELCGSIEWCRLEDNVGKNLRLELVNKVVSELADVTIYLFHTARVNELDMYSIIKSIRVGFNSIEELANTAFSTGRNVRFNKRKAETQQQMNQSTVFM